jgi:hypothetical protein
MRVHYLIILVFCLSAAFASATETTKKGPKVTDKVILTLLQLCSWHLRTPIIPLKSYLVYSFILVNYNFLFLRFGLMLLLGTRRSGE